MMLWPGLRGRDCLRQMSVQLNLGVVFLVGEESGGVGVDGEPSGAGVWSVDRVDRSGRIV